MKRLFTKYGVIVLALAALIAVILSVMAYFSTTAAVMPNIAGILAAPFRSAGAAVVETVDAWRARLTEYDELKAENEALKLLIAEMKASILAQPGVLGVDALNTRLFGDRVYVDVEIAADGELPLKVTHATAQAVHDTLEAQFPQVKHCMVHVNPAEESA